MILLSTIFERKMHSSKGMSDALRDRHLLDQPTRPKTAAGFAKKGISGIKRPASGKYGFGVLDARVNLDVALGIKYFSA